MRFGRLSTGRVPAALVLIWLLVVIPAGTSAELTPLLNVRVAGISLHIGDLVFAGWFTVVLVWALLWGRSFSPNFSFKMALLFLVWASVAAVMGFARSHSLASILRDYRGFLFYSALIPATLEIRTGSYARRCLWHFLAAVLAYACLVVILSTAPADFPLVGETVYYWYGERRVHFHNTFYLPVGLTMAFTLAIFGRNRIRIIAAVTLPVIIAALLVSQTRSAIGVSALGVAIAGWMVLSRKVTFRPSEVMSLYVSAVVAGTAVLLLGVFVESLSGRLAEPLHFPTAVKSVAGRFTTFVTALDLWRVHPIIGWGLGKTIPIPWASTAYKPWLAGETSGELPAVDNSLLTTGFKLGIVGVLLLVAVWGWIARDAFSSVRSVGRAEIRKNFNLALIGLAAALPGYFAVALTQNIFVSYRNIVVWMILARALAVISSDSSTNASGSWLA